MKSKLYKNKTLKKKTLNNTGLDHFSQYLIQKNNPNKKQKQNKFLTKYFFFFYYLALYFNSLTCIILNLLSVASFRVRLTLNLSNLCITTYGLT